MQAQRAPRPSRPPVGSCVSTLDARLRPQRLAEHSRTREASRRTGRRASPGSMPAMVIETGTREPEYLTTWGSDASARRARQGPHGRASGERIQLHASGSCATAASSSRASTPRWTSRGRAAGTSARSATRCSRSGSIPLMDLYTRHRTAGRDVFHDLRRAGDLRGQPLQPPGHADDPARDPAQVAQPHGRRRRGRLLLQEPLEGQGGRAAVQHGADRPHRRRPRQRRARPRRQADPGALEPADLPRGHALARRADRRGPLGRGRRSPHRTTSTSFRSTCTGRYTAMPPGRNWPKRLPGRFFSRRHRARGQLRRADPPGRHRPPARGTWPRCARSGRTRQRAGRRHGRRRCDVLLMHQVLREYEHRLAATPTSHFERELTSAGEPRRTALTDSHVTVVTDTVPASSTRRRKCGEEAHQ